MLHVHADLVRVICMVLIVVILLVVVIVIVLVGFVVAVLLLVDFGDVRAARVGQRLHVVIVVDCGYWLMAALTIILVVILDVFIVTHVLFLLVLFDRL